MKKSTLVLCFLISLSGCTAREVITNTLQVGADIHCEQESNVSYTRCGTNLEEEYKRGQELREQHLEDVDKELKQKRLEELKARK